MAIMLRAHLAMLMTVMTVSTTMTRAAVMLLSFVRFLLRFPTLICRNPPSLPSSWIFPVRILFFACFGHAFSGYGCRLRFPTPSIFGQVLRATSSATSSGPPSAL